MARASFQLTIADPTEAQLPALPDAADPGTLVWLSPIDGSVWAHGDTIAGEHWLRIPGVATYRFGDIAGEATAVPEPDARREAVVDAYYRAVLPMALQTRGLEVMHASAVVLRRGVVAFCGPSHAGKSTLAYAVARRGFAVWADDAVAFDLAEEPVSALPLPFRLRLRPGPESFFDPADADADAAAPAAGDADAGATEGVPIAALFVLAREDGEDPPPLSLEPLPPARAFPALFEHAYWFDIRETERKRETVARYLELVTRVPVFELRYASGFERLESVVDAVLAKAEGS